MTSQRGIWISVDGVEGAGKTTVARELSQRLTGSLMVDEFLKDGVGAFLSAAVRDNPHVISRSLVGQSLIFLGEFWERHATLIRPALDAGQVVVTDRGYLSKYAYQWTVLAAELDGDQADGLLRDVFATLPCPELTVLLEAPLPIIENRLWERDGRCSPQQLEFIERAALAFRTPPFSLAGRLVFDTSETEPESIADAVLAEVG